MSIPAYILLFAALVCVAMGLNLARIIYRHEQALQLKALLDAIHTMHAHGWVQKAGPDHQQKVNDVLDVITQNAWDRRQQGLHDRAKALRDQLFNDSRDVK